jgi:hypothetical protein
MPPCPRSVPVPNQLTIFENRLDPVQRNGVPLPLLINQLENPGGIFGECDLQERHADDFAFKPVVIADNEIAAAEFRVPADAMQEVLNGHHGRVTRWRGL